MEMSTGSVWRTFAKIWKERPEQNSVEQAGVNAQETIQSGDFTIDVARRSVSLGGQELRLTSEEFDVLLFLAGHPQRLVTPRTMLATSWNPNRLRQTEFLKVLLSLRAKLDAVGPGRHYLRTEPWVFYRFNPTSSTA